MTETYVIPELCQFCKVKPVYFTGHGIRDGLIYDEFSCIPCYAGRGRLSQERADRMLEEISETPAA